MQRAHSEITNGLRLLGTILVVIAVSSSAFADTLTTLASFDRSDGTSPFAGVTLSGGALYGTTVDGGEGVGVVFSVPVAGGTPTALVSFNGTSDGANPSGGVIVSGSTIYGSTTFGGADNAGVLFSESTSGGSPTVLTSFNYPYASGGGPADKLVLSGSTLYGSDGGGANRDGEVFAESTSGGAPTVLTTFDGTNGSNPSGVILSGNTLYGTTSGGGANGYGEIFSLPTTGGSPNVLALLNNSGSNSVYAHASKLILSGNTLYGTTNFGGAYGYGEVFSESTSGGSPTVLASFTANDDTGAAYGNSPSALVLIGSTLYGTTYGGGSFGDGELYSVPVVGGTISVLNSFDGIGTDGSNPGPDALITDGNGNLYRTTIGGGIDGDGTVFDLSVPEPATISLFGLSTVLMLRRRRF